ncbi:MAG TPA: ATP-binding protein [Candidatus Cybelea sp.]
MTVALESRFENSSFAGYPPYGSAAEELADQLARLNGTLERAIKRFRECHAGTPRGLDGVAVFDDEVDAFLAATPQPQGAQRADEAALDARLRCDLRAQATPSATHLPLDVIRRQFGLSTVEFDAFLLCLAAELHPGYGRVFAYLNNDLTRQRPTRAFLVETLSTDWSSRLETQRALGRNSALFRFALLTARAPNDELNGELAIEPLLLDFLLGQRVVNERQAKPTEEMGLRDLLVHEEERARLEDLVTYLLANEANAFHSALVIISGAPGSGRATAVRAICRELGWVARIFDDALAAGTVAQALRDARLAGAIPAFKIATEQTEERCELTAAIAALATLPSPLTFLILDADVAPRLPQTSEARVLGVHLAIPSAHIRTLAWKRALREHALHASELDLQTLAAVYPFTVGRIYAAAHAAETESRLRDASAGTRELAAACRSQTNHRLDKLAQPLPLRYRWSDIVLPHDELCRLKEIANAVRNRDRVMEGWGFNEKVSSGLGVNAIFFGPSGTGKTMAASILAAELGMAIYRVDLSRVVSKYIGETERNLDALFEEARRSFALLFFDEAEALFGKRSDVKDAHDRYANIEVAYLLQRMEGFEGVTILATNLRKHMDKAFLRRLQFAVLFPLPNVEQRRRIWQQVWPARAQLAPDLDLGFMAERFELTGGHIRNVAMMAAYLACEDGAAIAMKHAVAATRREFQKLGRATQPSLFGEYAALLQDVADD